MNRSKAEDLNRNQFQQVVDLNLLSLKITEQFRADYITDLQVALEVTFAILFMLLGLKVIIL
jgi:hypothetical protein